MKVIIQVNPEDDAQAWGILVRHSPGIALPNRVVIVSEEAAKSLRAAGIRFVELAPTSPDAGGVVARERV